MDDTLNLFPAWKQTVKEINQMYINRHEKGEDLEFMLDHPFFEKSLNIHDRKTSIKGSEEYFQHIGSIKDRLLKEHGILLDSIRSVGYLVLHPDRHGEVSASEGLKTMGNALEKWAVTLNNSDVARMTKEGLDGHETSGKRLSMHLHSYYQDKKRLPKKFNRDISGVDNDEDKEE